MGGVGSDEVTIEDEEVVDEGEEGMSDEVLEELSADEISEVSGTVFATKEEPPATSFWTQAIRLITINNVKSNRAVFLIFIPFLY